MSTTIPVRLSFQVAADEPWLQSDRGLLDLIASAAGLELAVRSVTGVTCTRTSARAMRARWARRKYGDARSPFVFKCTGHTDHDGYMRVHKNIEALLNAVNATALVSVTIGGSHVLSWVGQDASARNEQNRVDKLVLAIRELTPRGLGYLFDRALDIGALGPAVDQDVVDRARASSGQGAFDTHLLRALGVADSANRRRLRWAFPWLFNREGDGR